MEPRVDEVADRIYRICTFLPPEAVPPRGFTFNQFLIDADEPPPLPHRDAQPVPQRSAAVDRIVGLDRLRWIAFSHLESDECGAMNESLAACPRAEVIHGAAGVNLSLTDLADRAPRTWGDEVLEIGQHALRRRVLQVDTPHVPHNWEAQVVFEQETATLFAGDLGTQLGNPPPLPSPASSRQPSRLRSCCGRPRL